MCYNIYFSITYLLLEATSKAHAVRAGFLQNIEGCNQIYLVFMVNTYHLHNIMFITLMRTHLHAF